MKHDDYFRFIDPSTTDDACDYVFSALRMLPEDWQGYDVTFSQYGLAKMLVDLGHGCMIDDGTIVVKTTAGHRVYFTLATPFIGLATTAQHKVPHYAVIVPAGIAIDNMVFEIK